MNNKHSPAIGPLLILLAGVFWGCMGLFVRRLGACGFSSRQIACLRLSVGALVFVLLASIPMGIISALKNGKWAQPIFGHIFDCVSLSCFLGLIVIICFPALHHGQKASKLEAAVILVQFPCHLVTSLICIITVFLQSRAGRIYDFFPDCRIIGLRCRRPMYQRFDNI